MRRSNSRSPTWRPAHSLMFSHHLFVCPSTSFLHTCLEDCHRYCIMPSDILKPNQFLPHDGFSRGSLGLSMVVTGLWKHFTKNSRIFPSSWLPWFHDSQLYSMMGAARDLYSLNFISKLILRMPHILLSIAIGAIAAVIL